MRKKQLGNLTLFTLVLLNIILYLLFPPPNDGSPLFYNQLTAEVLSSSAMILMSCAIVLANRPRFLEPFFGGLDQMYKSHKTAALTAIIFLFLHFFIMPLSEDPLSLGRLLGKTALIGLSALIVLTLAPRIPVVGGYIRLAYHQWKLTHKFVGLFLIVGFIHMLQVKNLSKDAPIPNLYWNVIVYVGIAAYLYKELLAPFLRRPQAFVVEAVRRLNTSTLEVTLKPKGPKPSQTAGQFLFVSFPGDTRKRLAESHPFTVSSSPREDSLRLSIKASGDWTKHLYSNLQAGVEARVDGCYGQLDYKAGGKKQIWIAGGIGVTPFLSWVRDFDGEPDHEIDFFYTVRAEADALFADEFTAAAQKHQNFRATINASSKDGSLTADKIAAAIKGNIADRHIYLCGPLPMTEAFRKQFMAKGVPAGNIHFEEFNFR
jgi:predicted ferric reductase